MRLVLEPLDLGPGMAQRAVAEVSDVQLGHSPSDINELLLVIRIENMDTFDRISGMKGY